MLLERQVRLLEAEHSRLPDTTAEDPIAHVSVDRELGAEGFTYALRSGQEGTVHVEDVLEYTQDPDHLRDLLLDQTNDRKSVDQLLRLLQVLDCESQLVVLAKSVEPAEHVPPARDSPRNPPGGPLKHIGRSGVCPKRLISCGGPSRTRTLDPLIKGPFQASFRRSHPVSLRHAQCSPSA